MCCLHPALASHLGTPPSNSDGTSTATATPGMEQHSSHVRHGKGPGGGDGSLTINADMNAVSGDAGTVENCIAEALFHRISRAILRDEEFRVVVVLPVWPGFEGEVESRCVVTMLRCTGFCCSASVISPLVPATVWRFRRCCIGSTCPSPVAAGRCWSACRPCFPRKPYHGASASTRCVDTGRWMGRR